MISFAFQGCKSICNTAVFPCIDYQIIWGLISPGSGMANNSFGERVDGAECGQIDQ